MQIRPAMLPRLQKPSPNNSTSSGPSPRPARYGCAGSSFSAKESGGLIGSSEASEASLGAGSGSAAGFDPHGDEAERLLDYVPPWRTDDVIYLDLSDLSCPIGFNVLEREPAEHRELQTSCRSSSISGRMPGAPARSICSCARLRRSSTTPTGRAM